jgi:hypothetical protein
VVWSETRIEGGKPFSGSLPHPPTVTGPIQNIPIFDFLAMISGQATAPPTFYSDTAVIAYRAQLQTTLLVEYPLSRRQWSVHNL